MCNHREAIPSIRFIKSTTHLASRLEGPWCPWVFGRHCRLATDLPAQFDRYEDSTALNQLSQIEYPYLGRQMLVRICIVVAH